MGAYDFVEVHSDWCRCSAGHDMRGKLLQTHDLGRTYGSWEIRDDALTGAFGDEGEPVPMPFTGSLLIYWCCQECPAYLDPVNDDVRLAWVELEVELVASLVRRVWRVSDSSDEWIEEMRRRRAIGPMTLEEAIAECTARRTGRR